ncbi:GTP pyrophosphokinase [Ferrimonas gelatinilytica]|uniref:RelA/SpoT domain-containing protein n=1 Tax=Ferrimonas gelatinilytica TaxID=1255257 RepID=A0ABP9RWZ4_9GAMM
MSSTEQAVAWTRAAVMQFYQHQGESLEQVRALLQIRLDQLARAYCRRHRLPPEAVWVLTRVKPLTSVLSKLARKGWPRFESPTDVLADIIGARVVCWFVDDCNGMLALISSSKHLRFEREVEDYIRHPKASGYRAIHLTAHVSYDCVQGDEAAAKIVAAEIPAEIQVRSKLQDAWGDITHEFHYKAKGQGLEQQAYEQVLAEIAARLAEEDGALMQIRNAYQRLATAPEHGHESTRLSDTGSPSKG